MGKGIENRSETNYIKNFRLCRVSCVLSNLAIILGAAVVLFYLGSLLTFLFIGLAYLVLIFLFIVVAVASLGTIFIGGFDFDGWFGWLKPDKIAEFYTLYRPLFCYLAVAAAGVSLICFVLYLLCGKTERKTARTVFSAVWFILFLILSIVMFVTGSAQ